MIDVSILIVCYKSLPYINACVSSVQEHVRGAAYEILLLDCSNDGVVEHVRRKYPAVRIIDNHENLGFARGNNVLAAQASGRHLLLLNADAYLTDDSISELVRCADDLRWTPVGAVGGRARRPNGKRDPGSNQYLPTLFRLLLTALGGAKYMNGALRENATEPGIVESLTGAFMLVPSDVWREFGGLDESFFAYCEEMDFCMRLQRAGKKVVMTPHAEVVHIGGGGAEPSSRVLIKTRARMHLIRKHFGATSCVVASLLIWFHAICRVVGGLFLRMVLLAKGRELIHAYRGIATKPSDWCWGFK